MMSKSVAYDGAKCLKELMSKLFSSLSVPVAKAGLCKRCRILTKHQRVFRMKSGLHGLLEPIPNDCHKNFKAQRINVRTLPNIALWL